MWFCASLEDSRDNLMTSPYDRKTKIVWHCQERPRLSYMYIAHTQRNAFPGCIVKSELFVMYQGSTAWYKSALNRICKLLSLQRKANFRLLQNKTSSASCLSD